jgi:hypothetical protein
MKRIITISALLSSMVLAAEPTWSEFKASQALKELDCEFKDCTPKQPEVQIVEKTVIIEKPVIIEKEVIKEVPVEKVVEKVVYKESPVVKENPVQQKQKVVIDGSQRIYDAKLDIPIIGVEGDYMYQKVEGFMVKDDKVVAIDPTYNPYIKMQHTASWANAKLKDGKKIFLSSFNETIPYHRENYTQINFHVELPDSVIADDSTVVTLPKAKYDNTTGSAEEFASCRFNGFVPKNSDLQKTVQLNGKNYLDVACTICLYDYKPSSNDVVNMVKSETFEFMPDFRVHPPVRKGSKEAVVGANLKKFVFASELE